MSTETVRGEDMSNERIEESQTFFRLYRSFSALQVYAIEYIRKGNDDPEKLDRTLEVIDSLKQVIFDLNAKKATETASRIMLAAEENAPGIAMQVKGPDECEGGCWDPVTQQCIC